MWACGFFVARVPGATRPEFSGASALFVVLFALPSYASLWKWAGARRCLQVLVILGAFALGIETLAVVTGWPYGGFSYGQSIGAKVAGLVPWSVPFAWTPLVLGTHALTTRLLNTASSAQGARATQARAMGARALAGALALVMADLVLDPGAVHQKFWLYDAGGLYYGVPASNYFGWMLSGFVGHAMLQILLSTTQPKNRSSLVCSAGDPNTPEAAGVLPASSSGPCKGPPAGLAVSLGWTLAFWSSVCAWAGLWAPALIGHAFLLLLWIVLRPKAHPNPVGSRNRR